MSEEVAKVKDENLEYEQDLKGYKQELQKLEENLEVRQKRIEELSGQVEAAEELVLEKEREALELRERIDLNENTLQRQMQISDELEDNSNEWKSRYSILE